MCLVLRWAGRRRYHYLNDVWNCTEVCFNELGYKTIKCIGLRGWTFTHRQTPGDAHIEYRRLETRLKLHLVGKCGSTNECKRLMKRFCSMIEALFKVLKKDDEDRKSPSLNLVRIHKLASFKNIIMEDTQCYHMGVSTVLYISGYESTIVVLHFPSIFIILRFFPWISRRPSSFLQSLTL
jgi:hypothetical protein